MQHLESIIGDVRFAVRSFVRAPAFACAAVLTLALGVGATTSVFAFINGVLLRPLPYSHPDAVVLVWALRPDGSRTWLSVPELEDLQRRVPALDLAGLTDMRFALTGTGSPEELSVVGVSASLFQLLGIAPQAGRHFSRAEDIPNAPAVAVLSDGLWRRRFGGLSDIVGHTILLDGRSYTVIGIAPPTFSVMPPSSVFPSRVDVWVPLYPHLPSRDRDVRYLHAIGRLRKAATLPDVRAQLAAAGTELSASFPAYRGAKWSFDAVPMGDDIVKSVRPALLVLFAIVALVLCIACANVAALLLSRAASRRREMAVRSALGASPGRIARQLLTEGIVLSILGGSAGLAIASWAPLLAHTPPLSSIPRFEQVSLDWRVALFAAVVSTATAIVFALAPLIELSRNRGSGDHETLRTTARGHRAIRAGQLLAVGQIAISAIVVVVALALARGFAGLLATDLGFSPDGVLTMRIALPPKYRPADVPRFFDTALEKVKRIQGVRSAAAVSQLPLSGALLSSSFTLDGHATARVEADLRGITPDYFDTLRIALIEGRAFSAFDDDRGGAVAIVDETFARRAFPGDSAVGKQVRWIRQTERTIEIVGVVRAVRHRGMEVQPRETVYRPLAQYPRYTMALTIRSDGPSDPIGLAQPVIAAIHTIDGDQPVAEVATLSSLARRAVAASGFGAAIATTLAGLALILTIVGIYGLFSFAVAQRRREIGIRLALGASPSGVVRLVLGQGLRLTAAGLALGFPMAVVVHRFVAAKLAGIPSPEWSGLVTSAAAVILAIGLACWLPARRASKVSPSEPLRSE